jgi:hypothetical protein
MALELPLFTIGVARLPGPEINLAAHGGIVLPIALIVEAPIMMMLSASTALCRDAAAYRLVKRAMHGLGFLLTALHAAIAFTPLHDWLARDVIGVPEEVIEPARLGLRIMLPWTWAIAYRRFHQGLLIRAGRSRAVASGTLVRLSTFALVLLTGVVHGGLAGIVVGTLGIACGVVAEAAYVGWKARPVARELSRVEPEGEPLRLGAFAAFYAPLALTQLLALSVPPVSAAALSRMPSPLTSLAAWPAAWGFAFVTRSVSYAFNEVVVSLVDRPGGFAALRTFAHRLAAAATLVLVVFVATPLSGLWFAVVSGLSAELTDVCRVAVALAVLHPALGAFEMWFQGRLVQARRTRAVTIGMTLHVTTAVLGFAVAIAWGPLPGVYAAVLVLTLASAVKTAWLGHRARRFAGGAAP